MPGSDETHERASDGHRAAGGRVVVGYDDGERARDALALGRLLAERTDSTLVLAAVAEDLPTRSRDGEDGELAVRTDPVLAQALASLPYGVRLERRAVGGVPAHVGLARIALRERADLVVIGSSSRGAFGRVIPGSTGEDLLEAAPCPVLIAPSGLAEREPRTIRVIGLVFDAGEGTRGALAAARRLAEVFSVPVRIFAVSDEAQLGDSTAWAIRHDEPGPDFDPEALRGQLAEALREESGETQPLLLTGDPAERLVSAGERPIDLLVIGTRTNGPLRAFLLGSLYEEAREAAPCSALVVPDGMAVGEGWLAPRSRDYRSLRPSGA